MSSWLRGSNVGHHILCVSCTRLGLTIVSLSEGIGRENRGLDKHMGLVLLED